MTWTYSRWATYSATKRSQSISHSDLHLVYGIFMVLQQVRIVIVCLDGLPQLVLQRAHLARCFWHFSADFMGCCVTLWSILVTPLSPPKQNRHIKKQPVKLKCIGILLSELKSLQFSDHFVRQPIQPILQPKNAPRPPKLPQAWQCCFGALSSAHHSYWAQLLSLKPLRQWKSTSRCEKCSEKYMKAQWKTFWCPTQHFRIHLWDLVYPEGFAERLLNQKHFLFPNKTWTCPLDTSNQSFQGYQKEVKCQLVE